MSLLSPRVFATQTAVRQVIRRTYATTTTVPGIAAWSSPAKPESRPEAQVQGRAHSTWSQSLTFASPESDFASASQRSLSSAAAHAPWTHQQQRADHEAASTWSQTLSFASPESDFYLAAAHLPPSTTADTPLPRTWRAALGEERAAMVVTTARPPHRVVHVNAAWESLCGYTKAEALERPIGPLLQNDTYKSHTHTAARHLLDQLEDSHYMQTQEAYLENFTKGGTPFLNHLRVGPLYYEEPTAKNASQAEPDFLVAILEKVTRDQVPLRRVA
jgi:PAS domain S-box-containing protein